MTRIVAALLGVATVVVLVLVISGGSGQTYNLRLRLPDADGLRNGSAVVVGGVNVGTVSLGLTPGRADVLAELQIDPKYAPVGTNVMANIASVNLLGVKDVELSTGDKSKPAPSGFQLPGSQVTTATDLDQVLNVLDQNTRARLAVLINEAGLGFAGRQQDFSHLLNQLPSALSDGNALLSQLVSDNHTLGSLLASSNGFVSELDGQRQSLGSLIDTLGQTGVTVAAKNAQVRATIAKAPAALAQLQVFLNKLRATTVPLGPAAVDITATAGPLSATLAQLEPFRKAAVPAFAAARAVAPQLTRLADGATPVLQRANPVIRTLATASTDLGPVSTMLDRSANNLIGILDNWSKATSLGDSLSHVFRGEASYSTEVLTSAINNLLGINLVPAQKRGASRRPASAQAAAPQPAASAPQPAASAPSSPSGPAGLVKTLTKPLVQTLQNLLGGAVGNSGPPPAGSQAGSPGAVSSLLKYLLGR
jgi:virulence factor Mce-like protein